ncbi:Gem-associated protein 6 [Oryzias melastigma]|uniref:Gem-associated protein 6 n=1 Tax=Oryzias melastigma TaxID=30732 RepID=A0A834FHN1_ORYME|nr:Gem-associated protein 6 [Oryzias melastigma]
MLSSRKRDMLFKIKCNCLPPSVPTARFWTVFQTAGPESFVSTERSGPVRSSTVWSSKICLVLVNLVEGGAAVCVVMGHAVEEVELLQEAGGEMTAQLWALFEPSPSSSLDSTQTRRRRAAVCSWLRKNRVPVEEAGEEVRVAGALTIVAPYRPEDCSSSNQVILDRVQRLLRTQQERTEASD